MQTQALIPGDPCLQSSLSGSLIAERRLEFEDLLDRNLPRLRRLAMYWLRNAEDAEDAVQDALLSAFKNIARFEGRARMSTWLNAILINAVRMQLRRRPRCQMVPLDQTPEKSEWTVSEMLADPQPTPERTAEQGQLCELVTALIGGLPPSQRAVLRLRQRDDFSLRKAAEVLGVPVGTVKAQIARGRAKLIERFHKATRTRTRISASDSNSARKPYLSGNRGDRAKGLGHMAKAAFSEQGGYENWVGA